MMHRYFNIAIEIESIIDNALNRCFQFGDSPRTTRRILDHAVYLQQELSFHKEALMRCEFHSYSVDRGVEHCQHIFRDYCILLDDIASARSPKLLLDRLMLDISEFRIRLDTAHASLTQAIDDLEDSPPRRPPLPRPISYQDYDIIGTREQPSGSTIIINSNGGRRRSGVQVRTSGNDPFFSSFDDLDLPRARVQMASRRQPARYSDVWEEQGLEWSDGARIGYRHVRGAD